MLSCYSDENNTYPILGYRSSSTTPPKNVDSVDIYDELPMKTIKCVVDELFNTQVKRFALCTSQDVKEISFKRLTSLESVTLRLGNAEDYIKLMDTLPPSCIRLTLIPYNGDVPYEWPAFNQALLRLRYQLKHLYLYIVRFNVCHMTLQCMLKLETIGFAGINPLSRDKQRRQVVLIRVLPPDIGMMATAYL